ncbi:Phosphoinositide-specific phospholipase C, EF-hand-like domain [Dillenia turbinata]|uniref:Phosphoinositide phospholipase C n=1 Tax=Dillenia turbinata TaxID=194707 RepID=A0AAN8VGD0_9MAGN
MGTYKMCICFKRTFLAREAKPPADVKELFTEYAERGNLMTAKQLRRFLVEAQGEPDSDATTVEAEKIVEQVLQRHSTKITRNSLSLDDFHHFLFIPDLNSPIRSQVHHDMSAPLSHYFIFTGHNSYLTGNQLNSPCSEVPIIEALERGVRVIELDLWPNHTKDNVHVVHGRTLTSPVELQKCLTAIKEHAFSSSIYPVIVTLEDHLTPKLQCKAAQMIKQIFGDMLFHPESGCLQEIPSPEKLIERIIISTKPPKEFEEAKEQMEEENILEKQKGSNGNACEKEPSDHVAEHDDKSDSDTGDPSEENGDNDGYDSKSCQLGVLFYRSLIAIHAGKPKGGLREAFKIEIDKVRRLSLSEQKFEKAMESRGRDIVRFTQKNFLRVYPKGTRFDSSNFKPLTCWMHGAQMVAFNMQGHDKPLWLMQGMFRSNGGCGYVKKPAFLMNVGPDNQVFDPKAELPVRKILKVKIYMGDGWRFDFKHTHFDRCSPPDFYARHTENYERQVGIAGVPADMTAMKETRVREDEWTPVWDKEFTFKLTVPVLALLRVEVKEYDRTDSDDFAGQTCLPVSELRPGIRAVPLYDCKGDKYPSVRLLMRFVLSEETVAG